MQLRPVNDRIYFINNTQGAHKLCTCRVVLHVADDIFNRAVKEYSRVRVPASLCETHDSCTVHAVYVQCTLHVYSTLVWIVCHMQDIYLKMLSATGRTPLVHGTHFLSSPSDSNSLNYSDIKIQLYPSMMQKITIYLEFQRLAKSNWSLHLCHQGILFSASNLDKMHLPCTFCH